MLAGVLALAMLSALTTACAAGESGDGMNMYRNSEFVEKEQPEISAETKQLIAQYQKTREQEDYLKLRAVVIENYDAVLARKEAKLASLKTETAGKPGGEAIVAEMEEIVQEMYITYWSRINSSMLRFTDTRLLKWRIAEAAKYEYIPVMGAGDSIYVGHTPVTNEQYAQFVKATGHAAPANWVGGAYPAGEEKLPVNFVSYADAEAYCKWLTEKDGVNTYRLPQEGEWELAAGHMPKDADFNSRVNEGRTPVDQYAEVTRGAHGAVDFWGNVWEWTSTVPVIRNGRTLLPIRAVIESMGGTVEWEEAVQGVVLRLDGGEIRLTIGSTDATLNAEKKTLDVAPVIENGRTLLPIRFIAESFGFGVAWNEEEQSVTVSRNDTEGVAKLLYQGQGSVRIQTAEGKVIYIDPYAGTGYDLPADLILVTHGHRDHNALEKIETRSDGCVVITQVEALKDGEHRSFDFGYVKVEAVEAGYNLNHDVTECVGYVLTLSEGKKIYLSGDTSTTEQMPEMRNMDIDYAFFCCDGVYNMGLEEAAACAETVGAKHNIPYHMKPGTPNGYSREIAEQFSAPDKLIIDAGQEIVIE